MSRLTRLLVMGLLLPSVTVDGQATPVTSASEALLRALDYAGLAELEGLRLDPPEEVASLVTFRDSTTPFLSDSIDGRAAWRVEFEPVTFGEDVKADVPKTLIIHIDSLSGKLLRARSVLSDPGTNSVRQHSSIQLTPRLALLKERFHGLPDSLPNVTLFDALRQDRLHQPLYAKEIIAWYVVYSRDTLNPRPAWVLCMLDVPPVSSVPIDQTDRWLVVDATEGTGLTAYIFSIGKDEDDPEK